MQKFSKTHPVRNLFISIGALLGFLSVALGAFAAHFLKEKLDPYMLEVFKTGVLYQFFHALAIILVGILSVVYPQISLKICGVLFFLGILFFSGSLYVLSISNIKILGAITPIGGVLFLAGWIVLFIKSL
ncbi:MAG: DUF423 domain-containing protein [Bacteriovoracia bacterium]